MTGKDIFKIWAPTGAKWTQWVRPVPFVGINENIKIYEISDFNISNIYYLEELVTDTAIIVDIPGNDSIKEGIALAKMGYRPIPIYNGTDQQKGAIATVDNCSIKVGLIKGTKELEKIKIDNNAPPVFLLDTNRMNRFKMNISIFDNIYVEKKKIKSIEINIGDKYFNNSISIDLGYINKISIRTKTKTLFESLQHCIEENLNFTKKQNCIYKVQESILLEFLIIVVLMLFEIGLLLYLKFVCNIVLMEITNGLICIVLPVLIFNRILRYIESNYPPVDFNFGDNSVNKPKEPHKLWFKIIGYIFGSIIIPILLSIFF